MKIPHATYRLQLRREFGFPQAKDAVSYLQQLGISDCYLSPIHRARVGSVHGYDVLDHRAVNPELGTPEDLDALLDTLAAEGMGAIFDVVPNHMCVASDENPYWMDVLEDGPRSQYAHFFDIDWNPPKAELAGKVLLPFLGEQYGRVLENGLQVAFDSGRFVVSFYDTRLPLAARTWRHILDPALASLREELGDDAGPALELESIIRAIGFLPAHPEIAAQDVAAKRLEYHHELDVIRRRLADLMVPGSPPFRAMHASLYELNSDVKPAAAFARLETIMEEQGYRLANWRVAAHEVNYRRFFDINELAAIRVEENDVFNFVHELLLRLCKHPAFTGLRIDHIDGLLDPEQYLRDVQAHFGSAAGKDSNKQCYVLVEKILNRDEHLRSQWQCSGTTGYDFVQIAADVFVRGEAALSLGKTAAQFDKEYRLRGFSDVAHECKLLMLQNTLAAELTVLSRRLDRISEQHRYTRDFTLDHLHAALAEVIACFSTYRTYLHRDATAISPTDRSIIENAVAAAKSKRTNTHASVFDFIQTVLTLEGPAELDEAQRAERRRFVERFAQLCSPVYAKGVEDTTFYRFMPLVALNEVGCDPGHFGATPSAVHEACAQRLAQWPHTLSATATHDTKRGEDMRTRLYALSEVPQLWAEATSQWAQMNRKHKALCDCVWAPEGLEELLLYQTLVGAWPAGETTPSADFVSRIKQYMTKARMEAKSQSSWTNPRPSYATAAENFVLAVLDPSKSEEFLSSIAAFSQKLCRPGLWSSLGQTVLKVASPGVPDIYQGTETWDFSLVDPDNRRLIDYGAKRAMLTQIMAQHDAKGTAFIDEMMTNAEDGRIKTFVLARCLQARRTHRALFAEGDYMPVIAGGPLQENAFAFIRQRAEKMLLVVVGRWFFSVDPERPVGRCWKDSFVQVNGKANVQLRDIFTGNLLTTDSTGKLPLDQVLSHLPVAWLVGVN